MTQEKLIQRLKRGWLSSAQAFHEFGTLKLTSRVSELRKRMKVEGEVVHKNGKRFCRYRLR